MESAPGGSDASAVAAGRRAAAAVAIAGAVAFGLLGSIELAKDGSFWIDEAAVAESLVRLSPLELFGRLEGGQSFPRLLLVAISAVIEVFGYSTLAARSLPQLFFLATCAAWMRLLFLRFPEAPIRIVLGTGLLAIPPTAFVYGAMLKPYAFDAFLGTLPWLLNDAFYDRWLGRGEHLARGLALTACVPLSYPFSMLLLARVGGWWLARAARGAPGVSGIGAGSFVVVLAAAQGALWLTDLRHTAAVSSSLAGWWSDCIVGHGEADPMRVIARMCTGWWAGELEFGPRTGLPRPAAGAIGLALVAGVLHAGLRLSPKHSLTAPAAEWGSRSLGFVGLLAGLPLVSWVAGYPICAGRLTLFALLPVVVLILEGLALLDRPLERWRHGSRISAALGIALVVALAPAAVRDVAARARAPARQNLRPLLAEIRSEPARPILSNTCTRKLIETLPEGVEPPVRFDPGAVVEVALSESREAWLLVIPAPYCAPGIRRIRLASESFEPLNEEGASAHLYRIRLKAP